MFVDKNCLEGTREVVIRLKMMQWGIFGLGGAAGGLILAHHYANLGPYFGGTKENIWPHIPLHKEPTSLEESFNQLLANITYVMSNKV